MLVRMLMKAIHLLERGERTGRLCPSERLLGLRCSKRRYCSSLVGRVHLVHFVRGFVRFDASCTLFAAWLAPKLRARCGRHRLSSEDA